MSAEKLPQSPGKFGTRHVQTILMSLSLIVGYGMRISISIAVVAMTNKNENNGFRTYDWNFKDKGLILSAFLWGYAASQVPSGYLASTWRASKLFSIGLFLSSLVTLSTPFLADYGGYVAVCASRVAVGLFQACFLSSIHVLTSKWAPPLERSRISAYISSGTSLGTVLAMALSGLIADSSVGWPGIFYIFGSAGLVTSIMFYFNVTDGPAFHPSISQAEKNYIMESLSCAEEEEKYKPRLPWKKIMTSLPMWGIIFAHMGTNWGSYTIQTEIPEYIKSVLQFGMTENGLISSVYYIASWVLCFPYSWFADYAVIKGMSVRVVRQICNTVAMWGAAVVLIILCFVDTLGKAWPIAMLAMAGALTAGIICGFNVNHIDLSPNFAGAMYAISNCLSTFVSIVVPIVCSAITQDTNDPGPWHTVFYITAATYFITNLIYVLLAQGNTQSWNEKNIENIADPIKRLSVVSLYDTKILASVP
ncbi:putative inorganic phosphate cotransporter [Phymastichus coffea]|uniref:putative inorganic phosphate cotransporter n=1 Tax=Phymastichus coffea TaxID=108790 RepID=UPI00273AC4EC|nr:putative inorganic phosphate cotransporter [Phymastichus coffea]